MAAKPDLPDSIARATIKKLLRRPPGRKSLDRMVALLEKEHASQFVVGRSRVERLLNKMVSEGTLTRHGSEYRLK